MYHTLVLISLDKPWYYWQNTKLVSYIYVEKNQIKDVVENALQAGYR